MWRPCGCPWGRANGIQVGWRVWEGDRGGLRVTPFLEESSQTREMQRRGCRRPFSRLDGCAVVLKAFHRSECCVACNREGPPRIASRHPGCLPELLGLPGVVPLGLERHDKRLCPLHSTFSRAPASVASGLSIPECVSGWFSTALLITGTLAAVLRPVLCSWPTVDSAVALGSAEQAPLRG